MKSLMRRLFRSANVPASPSPDAAPLPVNKVELVGDESTRAKEAGDQYYQSGELDQAAASYAKAVALQPDHAEALCKYGLVLRDLGRLDEARASLDRALQLVSGNIDFHFISASIYLQMQKAPQAIEEFRCVLHINPQLASLYPTLTTLLLDAADYAAAVEMAKAGIALFPDFAELHFLLGNAHRAALENDAAIAAYRQALVLRPDLHEASGNLGALLVANKEWQSALEVYLGAFAAAPDNTALHANIGKLQLALGRQEEAAASFRAILERDNANAQAHRALGNINLAHDDAAGAILHFNAALDSEPANVDLLGLLAKALFVAARFDEALVCYERALQHGPQDLVMLCEKGVTLQMLGRAAQAVEVFSAALAIDSTCLAAHINMGNALQDQGNFPAAVGAYQAALALDPDNAAAINSLGSAYEAQGKSDLAEQCYRRVLAGDPQHLDAWLNLGGILQAEMKLTEAMQCFDNAIAIDPAYADAQWNKAVISLLQGDFPNGWRAHETRWTRSNADSMRWSDKPLWLGEENLRGKTLLVHAEQGLGDTMQFVRYVGELATLGCDVLLEVQAPMLALARASYPQLQVFAMGDNLPPSDFQIPLMSLPLACRTTIDTVPAATPYLNAPAERVEYWARHLPIGAPGAKKIGLVWSGNPAHSNDRNRSISLELLLPACTARGCQLYSLQKDPRPEDLALLGQTSAIIDLEPCLTDYVETAAIIANLDLVITVDTSVAHLAGAMNKPVWVLLPFLPDYRWLLDRRDSPWYPSARLYRQQAAGDWRAVMQAVSKELSSIEPQEKHS